MATRIATRKSNDIESLLSTHRLVRVEYYTGRHLTVTAKRDIPEWNVCKGEIVHLVASDSHQGYYYLITWNDYQGHTCSCPARYQCKHKTLVNDICRAKIHARVVTTPRQVEQWEEEEAHVEDSLTDFASLADAIIEAEKQTNAFDQVEQAIRNGASTYEELKDVLHMMDHMLENCLNALQRNGTIRQINGHFALTTVVKMATVAPLNARGKKFEMGPNDEPVLMAS